MFIFVVLFIVLILCPFTLIQDGISERLDNMGFLSEQGDFYSSMTPLSDSNVCHDAYLNCGPHHSCSMLRNSVGHFGFKHIEA